jgi:hypothetical protein
MADVTLTVYDVNRATGVSFTASHTDATNANTYYVPNDGRVLLILNSAAGSTVTVDTPNTVDLMAIANLAITATGAATQIHGPFPPSVYNDSSGNLKVTVSANTDLFAVRM